MPQSEKISPGFQPDIWDQGLRISNVVREKKRNWLEVLDDEFAEGRAKQVTEPLPFTCPGLKKARRLWRWREERDRCLALGVY